MHTLKIGELSCLALQILWTFSIYLEAVAILPQLVMLQRTQNIDNLTGNYVFLLGCATPACCPWLATMRLPCACPCSHAYGLMRDLYSLLLS